MIRLNGKELSGYEEMTVDELISRENFAKNRIAVEINGVIVSKRDYSATLVHAGDVIEVVSFVGGG